jgi:hypothetical protein
LATGIERDLALLDRLRQQGGDEDLADRREIEQRVAGHRPPVARLAEVVEQRAAVVVDGDRGAAGAVEERLDLALDRAADLGVGIGVCSGRSNDRDDGQERCCRHRFRHTRYAAHRSLLPNPTGTVKHPDEVGQDCSYAGAEVELIRGKSEAFDQQFTDSAAYSVCSPPPPKSDSSDFGHLNCELG